MVQNGMLLVTFSVVTLMVQNGIFRVFYSREKANINIILITLSGITILLLNYS